MSSRYIRIRWSSTLRVLLALPLLGAPAAHALDCWVPTVDQTQPRYAKMELPGIRDAVMAAEQLVRDNPHFRAMPRPIRIRSQLAVGPAWGQLNVKAYQPDVWEGACGLVQGADRCCSDGGINVMFNHPDAILYQTYAKDDELHIFREPRRTGTVAGFPEYESKVLISVDGRVPWLPVSVAEVLDFREREQLARIAEVERNQPKVFGVDPQTVQKSYENMKRFDPEAAEKFLADMRAQMDQLAADHRQRHERGRQLLDAGLAEIRQLRAGFTSAQLAAQAYHGSGPLQLGRADDPLSYPLVKADPNFPDRSDLNRVQMITVFVSVVENDLVLERKATMQRTKETFEYGQLAKYVR